MDSHSPLLDDGQLHELISQLNITVLYKHDRGNMGDVLVGLHRSYGKVILKALTKRLRSNIRFHMRWERELYATTLLSNYTLVPQIFSSGLEPYPWFIQEFISDQSLERFLKGDCHKLPVDKPVRRNMLLQLLDIVGTAARHGFVHRDIRPDNIVVDKFLRPYLIDWGVVARVRTNELVKATDSTPLTKIFSGERLTEPSRCHGVIGYIAPEQSSAYYDMPSIKNDIYSLVLVAIEVLTGTGLFNGKEDEEILAIQMKLKDPDQLLELHPTLFDVFPPEIHRFLLADTARRNQDLEQLRTILLHL